MSEMLSLSIKNIKVFWTEDPQTRPSFFPHKSLTCWGNGTEGKIEVSEAPHKRLGWGNLIFFAAVWPSSHPTIILPPICKLRVYHNLELLTLNI
jgi:hypothetical protein